MTTSKAGGEGKPFASYKIEEKGMFKWDGKGVFIQYFFGGVKYEAFSLMSKCVAERETKEKIDAVNAAFTEALRTRDERIRELEDSKTMVVARLNEERDSLKSQLDNAIKDAASWKKCFEKSIDDHARTVEKLAHKKEKKK